MDERELHFFLHPEENWVLGHVVSQEVKGTQKSKTCRSLDEPGSGTQDLEAIISDDNHITTASESSLCPVSCLLSLPYLHESLLLYHVRQNYWNDVVYTNIGPIVLALNPYNFEIPQYKDENMRNYVHEGSRILEGSKSAQPTHVWSVAHQAYWTMMQNDQPQSVLVSGESGAGKTEAAKMVVKYLAVVSTSLASVEKHLEAEEITKKVENCSPILEAFGNAKTLRNDNSSRFGKFMKLQFDDEGILCGALTISYLLEKSRVVSHAKGERSYHAFYQLVAGATESERDRYRLQDPTKFEWLYYGGPRNDEEEHEDAEHHREVRQAMHILGLDADQQDAVYRVVAGILHFQTIQFSRDKDGNAVLNQDAESLMDFIANDLWMVDPEELVREITMQTTSLYTRPLTVEQALNSRDAICKALYKEMFESLISTMNAVLDHDKESDKNHWLGLLDIFGFENFPKNSFEQLCINYANEQLQHHYNSVVFARDINEYTKEEIDVTYINPPNNQPSIDVISSRDKMGIFTLLDDQSKGHGTDEKCLEAIKEHHWKKNREHASLYLPRVNDNTFTIKHYAADVQYDIRGFRNKNMDPLEDAVKLLFRASRCRHIQALLPEPEEHVNGQHRQSKGKKLRSVASFFKENMIELMDTIYATNPFWVRCVKPHHCKQKRHFQGNEVMTQLRSAGVLETVKIRQSGYNHRLDHADFWLRFKVLMGSQHAHTDGENMSQRCQAILDIAGFDSSMAQIGLTKVFLKDAPFFHLEDLRLQSMSIHARVVQQFSRVKQACYMRLCKKMLRDAQTLSRFAVAQSSQHLMRQKEYDRYIYRVQMCTIAQQWMRSKASQIKARELEFKWYESKMKSLETIQLFMRTKAAAQRKYTRKMLQHARCINSFARGIPSQLALQDRVISRAHRLQDSLVVVQQFCRARYSVQRLEGRKNLEWMGESCTMIQRFVRSRQGVDMAIHHRDRVAQDQELRTLIEGHSTHESDEEGTDGPDAALSSNDHQQFYPNRAQKSSLLVDGCLLHEDAIAHVGDVSILRRLAKVLMGDLRRRTMECEVLKCQLQAQKSTQHRKAKPGFKWIEVPDVDWESMSLVEQSSKRLEDMYNARLNLRKKEEEWIHLKQLERSEELERSESSQHIATLMNVSAIEAEFAPGLVDFKAVENACDPQVIVDLIQEHKTAYKSIEERHRHSDWIPSLETYLEKFRGLKEILSADNLPVCRPYMDQSISNQLLQEPLRAVLDYAKALQQVSNITSTAYIPDIPGEVEGARRIPLDPESVAVVDEVRTNATKHLKDRAEGLKKEILQLRQAAAESFGGVEKRVKIDLPNIKKNLDTTVQAYVSKLETAAEEHQRLDARVKAVTNIYLKEEDQYQKELIECTERVKQTREEIDVSRQALDDSIARLMKLEVKKSEAEKKQEVLRKAWKNAELVLHPLREGCHIRHQTMIYSTVLLRRQKHLWEDAENMIEAHKVTLQNSIYTGLGSAHTQVWKVLQRLWCTLQTFYDIEVSTLECQTKQLHTIQNQENGDSSDCKETKAKEQRLALYVEETTEVLTGLQDQFSRWDLFLKTLKTYEFLRADGKFKETVANNFLADRFWTTALPTESQSLPGQRS